MILTEARGQVSGDQAEAHEEQVSVAEDLPCSCWSLLILLTAVFRSPFGDYIFTNAFTVLKWHFND